MHDAQIARVTRVLLALGLAFGLVAGCATTPADDPGDPACEGKCDGASAAPATLRANLLAHLMAQMDRQSVLFGQQRFNITGVETDGTQWLATADRLDRSDSHSVTGKHPVVMGFDAWDLAMKPESWAPTPSVHAAAARSVHARGGIVTMDWHMRGCAVDSFNAQGNEACLCRIANDDAFARRWLIDANYARLADALERHGLDRIPIVFRPLHEQSGSWFWWGAAHWNCATHVSSPRVTGADAYRRVFRTIVDYLRDERGLDNLLIAFAPDRFGDAATGDEQRYLAGYPGDDRVDVLGIDLYYQAGDIAAQTRLFAAYLSTVSRIARARGKAAALTEVGNTQIATDSRTWFSTELASLVTAPGVDLAYAMTWENRKNAPGELWVPFPGHVTSDDFRTFEASSATQFLGDTPRLASPPSDGYAVCSRCDSDPDGDRWGWEHAASCRVASWCLASP